MNPTILLVDLASAERENWKAFLEDQKYDVLTADNAESARRLCLELQPDLVLLHDHLPPGRITAELHVCVFKVRAAHGS